MAANLRTTVSWPQTRPRGTDRLVTRLQPRIGQCREAAPGTGRPVSVVNTPGSVLCHIVQLPHWLCTSRAWPRLHHPFGRGGKRICTRWGPYAWQSGGCTGTRSGAGCATGSGPAPGPPNGRPVSPVPPMQGCTWSPRANHRTPSGTRLTRRPRPGRVLGAGRLCG